MSGRTRPWPPLVVVEHLPRLIRWRDAVITLLMWLFFALLVVSEFELFLGDYLEHLGLGPFDNDADWRLFLERLMPYLVTAAAFVAALFVFTFRNLRRRSRARFLPQPPQLDAADQASLAGLDTAALIAAREQRIVIVHIDADGRHRIEIPPATG
jgi:poly-beta-1,6-N-acetyl-D-glucosamine biosynthesis protein PgaD